MMYKAQIKEMNVVFALKISMENCNKEILLNVIKELKIRKESSVKSQVFTNLSELTYIKKINRN